MNGEVIISIAPIISAEEAVKVVKTGDWIDYGWCVSTAYDLDKALAKHVEEQQLEDLKFRGGICMWRPAVFDVTDAGRRITWNSWHMSGIERKAINEGIAYYSPIRYSELPRYVRENG